MKIDLSYQVEKETLHKLSGASIQDGLNPEKAGHIGTHFDVMNGEFSIDNIITKGKIFDISHIKAGEVKASDIDLSSIQKRDFVFFYSGILKQYTYGTKEYFSTYTELSNELIDKLIDRNVSFMGVDMAGVKKPEDHPRIDQYCADRGVFIIENLNNLDVLLREGENKEITVYTFPVNMSGFSGLPCRVVAEI